jgi:hypothetical protein
MFTSAWTRRRVGLRMAAGLFALLLGCDSAPTPDSGYGAGQPVPPTKNCMDVCARSADCFVALCDENTSSTRYAGLRLVVDDQCLANCTEAQLQTMASDASWQCYFQSTCRQVFENDVCEVNARYSCP